MAAADKILDRKVIARKISSVQAHGGKVIFTCGVFDIIHVGHIRYLEFARALGDVLVVGVNSDESVRMLGKGDGRPINPHQDRAEVIAALSAVDFVCIYDELRPSETIEIIRPNIHVKDAAYKDSRLPEADAVERVGATVVFAPHVEGRSTSALVERLSSPRNP